MNIRPCPCSAGTLSCEKESLRNGHLKIFCTNVPHRGGVCGKICLAPYFLTSSTLKIQKKKPTQKNGIPFFLPPERRFERSKAYPPLPYRCTQLFGASLVVRLVHYDPFSSLG
eukprot:TRINITY_DN17795_c0_g1_i1.p1 TRINITY_DN17795_c0_g1~~TRINITY_DN17795_c0_g1_i1.p1  ORF type:complete len:113 (-),score=0.15 TRINITY_DN17795_c0_g1_i1:150-488(-)